MQLSSSADFHLVTRLGPNPHDREPQVVRQCGLVAYHLASPIALGGQKSRGGYLRFFDDLGCDPLIAL